MNPAIQRRLLVAATARGLDLPRTVANALEPDPAPMTPHGAVVAAAIPMSGHRQPVTADSAWGDFLSEMNRAVGRHRDTITQAMEEENIEPIVDVLSEAMQSLLDALAEKLGYDLGDGGSDDEGESGDAAEGAEDYGAEAGGADEGPWQGETIID